jgi:hypothetical protein
VTRGSPQSSNGQSDIRVYRLNPWRRASLWLVLGPCVAVAFVLSIFAQDDASRLAAVVVAGVLSVCLAAWEWLVRRTTLVLSATGVQLHQLGMDLAVPWCEIEELRLVRGREGLIVRRPLASKGAQRLAALGGIGAYGAPLYDDEQRTLIAERRWIPIEPFAWYARHGSLVADVALFAPAVPVSDAYPAAEQPAVGRRARTAAILISALAIGGAIALAVFGDHVWVIVALQCVAAPFLAYRAASSAWHAIRSRSLLLGTLLGASTLIMTAWTLVSWVDLIAWLDSEPPSSILPADGAQ